jgi:hypothetical protein
MEIVLEDADKYHVGRHAVSKSVLSGLALFPSAPKLQESE